MVSSSTILTNVHAEPIACGLRDRILGLGAIPGQRQWRGVLLRSGTGSITQDDENHKLQAPCLVWMPWREGQSFKINAGGTGFQFTIDDLVLANAIGHNPESADLRYFLDRQVIAPLTDEPATAKDAEHAFDVIVREIAEPRTGSWTMVQAQVRAILVFLWRVSGGLDQVPQARGQSSRILLDFRQLLEAHFRDRWSVQMYADTIGITADRLHDICRRELEHTPLQLVQERVVYEARLRLERSTQTVDQVALSLGFKDVGHFSRFFKSKVGVPPGMYRENAARPAEYGLQIKTNNYSNWP